MKLTGVVILIFVISSLYGCAPAINLENAEKYYDLGLKREAAGDYASAQEAFRRALINARSGGASPAYVSAVTYNMGRMSGYTCRFEEAEALLKEALRLEESLEQPVRGNITKRLSELARLSDAMGKTDQALAYYDRAVPRLEELGIVEQDPIGYANYLELYASALRRAGQANQATHIQTQAETLRASNPQKTAQFVPVLYQELCGS